MHSSAVTGQHGVFPGADAFYWNVTLPSSKGRIRLLRMATRKMYGARYGKASPPLPTDALCTTPSLVPGVWRDKSEQSGLVQRRAELGTEHHGERLHGDKEGCA